MAASAAASGSSLLQPWIQPREGVARPYAAWTGGSGEVTLKLEGVPGAVASGRPLGKLGV